MPASARRDLYLQVDGNIDKLRAAMKAGRSVLVEFGTDATATTAQIQEAFTKLGGGAIEQSARTIDAAYARTFANIRANAQAIAGADSGKAALQILDASGAEQAAAAAETQAASLRIVADAAARAAEATEGDAAATRVYATAAAAAALGAEEQAASLRAQATVLASVRGQLGATTDAENEAAASHQRMGAAGMIAEHVVRSFSDSIAAGQSPARALTLEMGRITEAMTLFAAQSNATEGKLAKFAGFMGGPWGLAISLGAAVLTPLIGDLLEAGDALSEGVDKLKKDAEQTEISRRAHLAFSRTLEGQIDTQRRLNDELERGNVSQRQKLTQDLSDSQGRVASSDRDIPAAVAAVAAARQRLRDVKLAQPLDGTSNAAVAGAHLAQLDEAQSALSAAENRLQSLRTNLNTAQQGVRDAQISLASLDAKAAVDPVAGINKRFDEMADAARAAAKGNDALAASLAGTLAGIERNRAAALKAEQERQRQQHSDRTENRQVGREITLPQAEALIQGIGGRITSAYRSPAEQQVLYDRYRAGTGSLAARPGTSLHETGQALDVAKTAGVTLATIRKAFEAAGVRVTELLDEGNHYHVGWGPKGASADTMAKRQQAATVHTANDDRAFASEYAQAQDRIADVEAQLAGTADARLKVELDRVDSARAARYREISDQVTAGKIDQVRAVALRIAADEQATGERTLATNKARSAAIQEQLARDRLASQGSVDMLQLQLALAKTLGERRDLARQILAREQAIATGEQQAIIDDPTSTDTQKDQARARQSQLVAQYPVQQRQLEQQYEGPLARYGDQLRENVGNMNTALQGVAVDGLKGVEDGLTGLISGTERASQAFKNMAASIVSDLVRIGIEKAIISFVPGLATGGSVPGFATGGEIPGFAYGGEPSVSGSGRIHGPGTGTSDSILALVGGRRPIRVSAGETIMNAHASALFGPVLADMNAGRLPAFSDGGPISIPSAPASLSGADMRAIGTRGGMAPISFDLRGAVVTEDLLRQMNGIAAQHAAGAQSNATEAGASLAQSRMMKRANRKLGRG